MKTVKAPIKSTPARKPAAAPAAAPAKKDALATRKPESKALVNASITEMLLADEGAGQEGIGRNDLAIPRLAILQSGSPAAKKSDPSYIDGAEEGDIMDSLTNELFSGEDGIIVIPVSYRRANLEWIPQNQGGGFVADHGSDDSILAQCKKAEDSNAMLLPNGHEIVTTGEYFCYLVDPTGSADPRQVVISMAKTQLKKSRKWNSMITSLLIDRPNGQGKFNPAMFYRSYLLTTVPESKDKYNWFGWKVVGDKPTLELPNGQELYLSARAFRESVQKGDVQVAAPSAAATSGESDDSAL